MITCSEHDWRLITETTYHDNPDIDENTQIHEMRVGILGWRRKWYCTKCRTVETTEDPS